MTGFTLKDFPQVSERDIILEFLGSISAAELEQQTLERSTFGDNPTEAMLAVLKELADQW